MGGIWIVELTLLILESRVSRLFLHFPLVIVSAYQEQEGEMVFYELSITGKYLLGNVFNSFPCLVRANFSKLQDTFTN
jgi:hypothetical protein